MISGSALFLLFSFILLIAFLIGASKESERAFARSKDPRNPRRAADLQSAKNMSLNTLFGAKDERELAPNPPPPADDHL